LASTLSHAESSGGSFWERLGRRCRVKPIRYKEEMVNEFLNKGYWTQQTFYDFYERNARELGESEALGES